MLVASWINRNISLNYPRYYHVLHIVREESTTMYVLTMLTVVSFSLYHDNELIRQPSSSAPRHTSSPYFTQSDFLMSAIVSSVSYCVILSLLGSQR